MSSREDVSQGCERRGQGIGSPTDLIAPPISSKYRILKNEENIFFSVRFPVCGRPHIREGYQVTSPSQVQSHEMPNKNIEIIA